ncbi:MAG: mitochondrial fission ELM1 family protein [Pseudomonadota bacterium]
MSTSFNSAEKAAPRVWLVIGDKLGDNAQVEILAKALGWPVESRNLRFRSQYIYGKPRFRPSLYHLDRRASDSLEPPWPDLVLTIGRRPSMAALWIKRQSGGRTKVVIVGRPKRYFDEFDLVVGTPQYRLPDRQNVVTLDLPLMRADMQRLEQGKKDWAGVMDDLPRPLTAVLIGGQTRPFRFDGVAAEEFLQKLSQTPGLSEGTLYITTSRRTPRAVGETLERRLPSNARLYRWESGHDDNPYFGLLACADRFVVTGDSISMMVEVARLGRPLAIYPLPYRRSPIVSLYEKLTDLLHGREAWRWLGEFLSDRGLIGYPRRLPDLHDRLVHQGRAVMLGQPFVQPPSFVDQDLDRAAAAIKQLFRSSFASSGS